VQRLRVSDYARDREMRDGGVFVRQSRVVDSAGLVSGDEMRAAEQVGLERG
jgi:hypothetical protein